MKNINRVWALIVLGLMFAVMTSQAQQSNQDPMSSTTADSTNAAMPEAGAVSPSGREACWQRAGISKSVMEHRKAIVSGAQLRIRSIEGDSTLTPSQQKQQVRQIRMDARQQVEKLITPEQQESLRQCRQERGPARQGAATSSAGNSTPPDTTSTSQAEPK